MAFFSPSKAGIYYSDIPEGESQASSDTSLSAVAFYSAMAFIHESTHAQHVVGLPVVGIYP